MLRMELLLSVHTIIPVVEVSSAEQGRAVVFDIGGQHNFLDTNGERMMISIMPGYFFCFTMV